MSAFLGPIHIKMYDRVLFQDAMTKAVLDAALENGWTDTLAAEVDSRAPAASRQPLDTIIDQGNIHGWLSEAVARCERRFALAMCGVLAGHPDRMNDLRQVMRALGKAYSVPPAMDAEQAFGAVHDVLLDGMPCDFPFAITQSNPSAVAWQVTNCPHAPYWKDCPFNVETYYRLRDAWIDGALEDSGIAHIRSALYAHSLRKEDAQ